MSAYGKAVWAAVVLFLPAVGRSEVQVGPYVGAGIGANYLQSSRDYLFDVGPDLGFAGVLGLGWHFGNGLRAELEGNLRTNNVSKIRHPAGLGVVNPSGRVGSYGVMANLLFDVDLRAVVPYVGGGLGYAWHHYDRVGGVRTDASGQLVGERRIDDAKGNFAYQAIAGFAVPIAAAPGLAITAEYRFFGTLAPTLRGVRTDLTAPADAPLRTTPFRYQADNHNHSVLLGLRYTFGVAPGGRW